jgi:Predicted membrane protein (DUF2207) C-terminal domain/Predicted membrane protein (DUF2207) N-terminal domain
MIAVLAGGSGRMPQSCRVVAVMRTISRTLVVCAAVALLAPAVRADEGWVINRFEAQFDIRPDGVFTVLEALDVDFGGLSKHGIYRDIPYRFSFDSTRTRQYDIAGTSVTSADGRPWPVQASTVGALRRLRIGDANRTVSGQQTYRIAYRVANGLNGFADHDELYWNASGTWPVRMEIATATVRAPAGAIERVTCFQGRSGSTEPCDATFTADEATFTATRPLAAGEQLTIVTALAKGAVAEPAPHLLRKARPVTEFFDRTPLLIDVMLAGFVLAVGGVGTLWWRFGRDRRFIALHGIGGTVEERVPLFGARPVGVEFEPPEKIRPGQMGLLIDERADTLDVTSTIIDLAVRGYLKITEVPKHGWFGHADWQLDQLKAPDAGLLEYEQIVLDGLFKDGSPRKLSELKNKFYRDLSRAKAALYRDGVARGWFPQNPNTVRAVYAVLGVLGLAAGIGLTIWLGQQWGAGLVGLPVAAGGLLVALAANAMPRRTAAGREMLMRTLGFVRYIKTAETHQQAFAERANIFTAYLPYAIAFRCVDKWARAFKDLDLQRATAGWYVGASPFNAGSFSSSLTSFSSSVASTLASTPGGSGSSGFGGSAGGGGGGGGGGSW